MMKNANVENLQMRIFDWISIDNGAAEFSQKGVDKELTMRMMMTCGTLSVLLPIFSNTCLLVGFKNSDEFCHPYLSMKI